MEFVTPPSSFYQYFPNSSSIHFKIITWNVWFDEFEQKARYNEILRICSLQQPDVICFQEVTYSFLQVLEKWDGLSNYAVSNDDLLQNIGPYGIVTLAKKEYLPEFTFHSFPTNMGRKLLVTKLILSGQEDYSTMSLETAATSLSSVSDRRSLSPSAMEGQDGGDHPPHPENPYAVYIGNVHLESLEYHHIREQQLEICAKVLSSHSNYLLCGDFNFCSYRNRPFCFQNTSDGETTYCRSPKGVPLHNNSLKRILPNMNDLWAILKPREAGYTLDGSINEYCNQNEFMRYDRICFSFSSAKTQREANIGDENHEPIVDLNQQRNILSRSFSMEDLMVKPLNLVIEPKFIHIIGNDPVVKRKLSDAPPPTPQQAIFTSPQQAERPYRAIYNRKLITVYPSDHFGLCGSFEMNLR